MEQNRQDQLIQELINNLHWTIISMDYASRKGISDLEWVEIVSIMLDKGFMEPSSGGTVGTYSITLKGRLKINGRYIEEVTTERLQNQLLSQKKEERERKESKKLDGELLLMKWQKLVFWPVLIGGAIGGVCGIISLWIQLTTAPVSEARYIPTKSTNNDEIQSGDIIFQTSLSKQSKAIQLATKSKYSHCGLIYKDNDKYYVFEAVQPVKKTLLSEWITRGKDGKFAIKRLRNADDILSASTLAKMKQVGSEFTGKNYDLTFEWSDEKMYCSELVWKIYKRAAGIEIGQPEKLSDFELTSEEVKRVMTERYGDKIPMNETVISPEAIFNSELLITVKAD
jgi:hypothetical protein